MCHKFNIKFTSIIFAFFKVSKNFLKRTQKAKTEDKMKS